MYPLKPVAIYMLEGADSTPAASARIDRILKAIGRKRDEVVVFNEADAPDVVARINAAYPPKEPLKGVPKEYTRSLVFTTLQLNGQKPDTAKLAEKCGAGSKGTLDGIFGCFPPRKFRERERDQELNHVCWCAYEFGTMQGCPHGCMYCGTGRGSKFIALAVNLEEFAEKCLVPTLKESPWQRCYRIIGWGADKITFEPEYGLFDLVTTEMAKFDEKYAYFHSGSTNVKWIADLPHRDRIIGVWSITCDAGAKVIEPGAGAATDRFDAAGFLESLGIATRLKFKPIIPIKNWRREYAKAIKELFKRCRPESIGLAVYMWNTVDTLKKSIAPSLLDPKFLKDAEDAAEEMKDVKTGPYPQHIREEIYRFFIKEIRKHDKDVLIYLSTESREIWDALEKEIGQKKRAFICGCGAMAVPGKRLALASEMKFTTYSATDS
ncbi:MAG: hypothetical protein AB1696_28120 [Planctomycetota bacterium]